MGKHGPQCAASFQPHNESLLGERNAINFPGKDAATDKFKADAKKLWATVVTCEFGSGYERYLDRVIDPLPYAEQKER